MAPRARGLPRGGGRRPQGLGRAARATAPAVARGAALAAPFAGFGGEDAYPTLEQKAAVLLERLARNHPLPDGNKRAAFVTTVLFLEVNGHAWSEPDLEADASMVERVAAGEADIEEITAWVRRRIEPH